VAEGGGRMNILIILFYVWTGMLGHVVNYMKQVLFQGKDVLASPWEQLKDLRFTLPLLGVMCVTQGTWLLDALVRQKLKFSQTYGYASLISTPISAAVMMYTLWLSERHLSDHINWWAVSLMVTGIILHMVGGYFLLGGQK